MSITELYRVFIGQLVLLLRWLLSYNKIDCGIFGIFPDVERLRIEFYRENIFLMPDFKANKSKIIYVTIIMDFR